MDVYQRLHIKSVNTKVKYLPSHGWNLFTAVFMQSPTFAALGCMEHIQS